MRDPLTLDSPFLLAPMAGFTTSGVRRLLLAQGAGAASTGLVDAEGLARGSAGSLRRAFREEADGPQILQLFANQPAPLEEAAAMARGLGYAGVELNLGCPAGPLLARGCCGALLGRWELLATLLAALRRGAGDLPAGIKGRSGKVPGDGMQRIQFELAAEADLDWFCLHPRSLACGYERDPDWSLCDGFPAAGPRLWAVGELRDAEAARSALARHPRLEAVLIGRAALTRPWLFAECLGRPMPGLEERAALLVALLRAQVSDLDWQEARRLVPKYLGWLGLPSDEDAVFRLADRRQEAEWRVLAARRLAESSLPALEGNPFLR